MSNDQKESHSTAAKKKKKKRRYFLWLSSCSTDVSVFTPGAVPPATVGSKSRSSPWFSWSGICKKTKRTELAAPVVRAPSKASLRSHRNNDKKPPSKTSKLDGREEVNEGQKKSNSDSNLVVMSFQCSAHREPAPVIYSDSVRTSFSVGQSAEMTRHAVRPAVGLWLMIATLAVMVLAGRATAVVWFCCSFYLLQGHRPAFINADSGCHLGNLDNDSGDHLGDLDSDPGEFKGRLVREEWQGPSLAASVGDQDREL